jgi:hypothetical protein
LSLFWNKKLVKSTIPNSQFPLIACLPHLLRKNCTAQHLSSLHRQRSTFRVAYQSVSTESERCRLHLLVKQKKTEENYYNRYYVQDIFFIQRTQDSSKVTEISKSYVRSEIASTSMSSTSHADVLFPLNKNHLSLPLQ